MPITSSRFLLESSFLGNLLKILKVDSDISGKPPARDRDVTVPAQGKIFFHTFSINVSPLGRHRAVRDGAGAFIENVPER